jgi:hypothetical protein
MTLEFLLFYLGYMEITDLCLTYVEILDFLFGLNRYSNFSNSNTLKILIFYLGFLVIPNFSLGLDENFKYFQWSSRRFPIFDLCWWEFSATYFGYMKIPSNFSYYVDISSLSTGLHGNFRSSLPSFLTISYSQVPQDKNSYKSLVHRIWRNVYTSHSVNRCMTPKDC